MDNKLLLVNGITLLYRESQLKGTAENSSKLVRDVLEGIKLPELSITMNRDREIMDGLMKTALTMCNNPSNHTYELMEVLQTLKVNTLDEEALYEALYDGIHSELTESALRRTCLNLKRTLNNYFREKMFEEKMSKAWQKYKFEKNKITNFPKFVKDFLVELEPYQVDTVTKDPAIINEIDLNDLSSVEEQFKQAREAEDGVSVLQTGSQGLNRMLGGGFRRGENVVIGALQHQHKTGTTMMLFKQIALYNTPQMRDPSRKPLLLRISFEDDVSVNFQALYVMLKENETKVKVDLKENPVPDNEIARYVKQKLQATGYEIKLLRVDPSQWTYKDITNKVLEYEAEGYEVHLLMLDYLLKIPTTGCDDGPAGHAIRNMYERIYNFTKPRGIVFITPHQLSTEAKTKIREGALDFVKILPGMGYYAGSKQIDQVVDIELFIHIEKVNGESYLTIQRGKMRRLQQIPEKDQYMVLKFEEAGPFIDDIHGEDRTRRKVGGGAVGSTESTSPFWDYSAAI